MTKELLVCKASFEGYPVQALAVDRKPGVAPDGGWIELYLQDFEEIRILDDFRPWGAVGIREPAGPFIVEAARNILRPTITEPRLPEGAGFLRGGILKLRTDLGSQTGDQDDDRKIDEDGEVQLNPMFIATGGIEEADPDLETAIEHKEGRVRINLVDFRYWWQKYGTPMYGRYNVLLENGNFDESTIDQETGEPYPLTEILNMIALGLPGAPAILRSSDIFLPNGQPDPKFQPPVNLDMQMELPVVWLQDLLLAYDLECHLTHDSQILVKRRGREHQVRKFRRKPGGQATPLPAIILPDNPNEERKTVFVTDKPEAVSVVGSRRQHRFTVPLIPAFIDLDGEIRALEDLPKLWDGYTTIEAREQIFVPSERQFQDLPGDIRTRFARRRIAQAQFYKLFAPSFLFTEKPPTGGRERTATSGAGAIRSYWPFEERKHPWMPMFDPWFLPKEIEEIGKTRRKEVRFDEPRNPNFDPLTRTDILVRANTIQETHVEDASEATELIDAYLEEQGDLAVWLQTQIARQAAYVALVDALIKADEFRQLSGILGRLGELGIVIQKGLDVGLLTGPLGSLISADPERVFRDIQARRTQRIPERESARIDLERLQAAAKEVDQARQKVADEKQAILEDLETYGFARLWVNVPFRLVNEGLYTVDREIGLVQFHDVVGTMEAAATYDRAQTKLLTEGHVEITFMAEVDQGSPTDYSVWTFAAPKEEAGGKPTLVRISNLSPLKPQVIRESDMVMYEDEVTNVMNADATTEKAARLARALLDVPRQQDGYSYRYPGFWKVITDEAVNQVSWTFDGDLGHTSIVANNPELDAGFQSLGRKRLAERFIHGTTRR